MRRVTSVIERFPLLIIVAFVASCAAALAVHYTYARYDFSYETMAPKRTRQFELFEEFLEIFGEGEDLYLIAFQDDPLLTNNNLEMVDRITKRIEELHDTGSVTSLTNVLDIQGLEGALDVSEFVDGLPQSDSGLEALRLRLTSDPLVAGNLISSDGSTAAFVGRLHEWSTDPSVRIVYFDQIEEILAEEGQGRIEFHIAGEPFMDRTLITHMIDDTSTFMPITVLVFAVAMWIAFGQLRWVWMPIVPILISGILTLGALTGSGRSMSVLTGQGVMMMLIMVIGLSDAVHLLNRYREDVLRRHNEPRLLALADTIGDMGVACFLTSLTTSIGFLSLAIAEIPTIKDFGTFGALGIGFAYLGAILFLPATIVLMERWRQSPVPRAAKSDALDRMLDGAADLVIHHPRPLIAAGVIVLLLSASGAAFVRIDNRWTKDLKANDPAVVSLKFLEDHMSGPFQMEIIVEGDRPDAVKDPQVLADMEAVREGLEAMPTVSKVLSPAPYIKKMNRAMNEGRPEEYRLPDTSEAVAQYLLLFEMAGSDSNFERLVNYDYSVARMTALIDDITPEEHDDIVVRLDSLVEGRFGDGIEVYESGDMPLFYTVTDRLISTLIRSLYFAMPLIFLITIVFFRSIKLGVLSALPNILPLTMGMGLLGVADISLRFSTIIAFPVAFGIAIDDTIHFLARYRTELAAGNSPEDAIRTTLRTAGRAMVLTTVLLVAGYAVFLTSNFLAAVHMGILLMVILTGAVFGDVYVLPALLLTFRPKIPVKAPDKIATGD